LKRSLIFLLLFSLLVPAAADCGQLHPSLKADRDFYNIGDPITLSLELKGKGHQLQEMEGGALLPFEISGTEKVYDNNRGLTVFYIRGAVFNVGEFEIPPLRFIDEKGSITESSPIMVTIASLIENTGVAEAGIKDIKPQVEIDEGRALWPFSVPLMLIAALIAGLLYMRRKKRAPVARELKVEKEPYLEAMDELRRIEELDLLKSGKIREHYSLISDLVRRFTGRVYGINSMEMTTSEITSGLEKKKIEDLSGLGSFLYSCDMVKFAKYDAPVLDASALAGRAGAVIESLRADISSNPDGGNHGGPPVSAGPEGVKKDAI